MEECNPLSTAKAKPCMGNALMKCHGIADLYTVLAHEIGSRLVGFILDGN